MKIIVIGTPRTSTSITCEFLAKKFSLSNLEYLTSNVLSFVRKKCETWDCEQVESAVMTEISSFDNIVLKNVGGCMSFNKSDNLQTQIDFFSSFDKIVFCSRNDLLAQYRSWVFLQSNVSVWFEAVINNMTISLQESYPEILNWDFTDQSQIGSLIQKYRTLYTTEPKIFDLTPVAIPDSILAETGIQRRMDRFATTKMMLLESCPEKCFEITYEMWQQDPASITTALSSALNITVTEDDLVGLKTTKNNLDYTQIITNITDVDARFAELFPAYLSQ